MKGQTHSVTRELTHLTRLRIKDVLPTEYCHNIQTIIMVNSREKILNRELGQIRIRYIKIGDGIERVSKQERKENVRVAKRRGSMR